MRRVIDFGSGAIFTRVFYLTGFRGGRRLARNLALMKRPLETGEARDARATLNRVPELARRVPNRAHFAIRPRD